MEQAGFRGRLLAFAVIIASLALAAPARARTREGALPDPAMTPGATNPRVTQADIGRTICVRGWTRTVRPLEDYTYHLKVRQLRAGEYPDRRTRDYEEDHLIPLGLGGAPRDPRNLWPEPWAGRWGARTKDRLESRLHRLVCEGRVSLRQARSAIASDWIAAYRRYMGGPWW